MSKYPQNTYVGMRYVPLFDGDWNAEKEYEPLTVVNVKGDSYTSKTFVPAGVNPVGNDKYWALTGNYNAQIAAYREELLEYKQEVATFNDRIEANKNEIASKSLEIAANTSKINDLENKKLTSPLSGYVLLIGDSYCEGYTPDGNVESWAVKLKRKFGNGANILIKYAGGCGFYAEHEGINFKKLIETCVSENEINADSVTCIICAGGYNDSSETTVEQYNILTQYMASTFTKY